MTLRTYVNRSVVEINYDQCVKFAIKLRDVIKSMTLDTFTNEEYYPGTHCDAESVARYFIFMVAIDHRTSRLKPFEGYVHGKFYHGADLLYRLGMLKFKSNPEFFNPKNMAKISVDDIKSWLSVEGVAGRVTIWDPEIRADLLRDLAIKLLKYYDGKVLKLIEFSRGLLKSSTSYGFIDRLKAFKAYSDPVEKKAYLLTKFLARRRILKYSDEVNAEVPVDNHLTRIALRIGLISIRGPLFDKVIKEVEVNYEEDIWIRLYIRKAYKLISRILGIDPLILDDFLWFFGRKCCVYEKPFCITKIPCKGLGLEFKVCPFKEFCKAFKDKVILNEHTYRNTYYY